MSRQLNESSIFGTISAKEFILLTTPAGDEVWRIRPNTDGSELLREHKEGVPLAFVEKEATIA